jgi:hypothetical protein
MNNKDFQNNRTQKQKVKPKYVQMFCLSPGKLGASP